MDMQKRRKKRGLYDVVPTRALCCGEPIIRYAPSSYGAEDYSALTEELLQKIR